MTRTAAAARLELRIERRYRITLVAAVTTMLWTGMLLAPTSIVATAAYLIAAIAAAVALLTVLAGALLPRRTVGRLSGQ
ncbi:hypothetical protein [Amycolatopsis sp. MEPSY49]|uniref:hypothetical protein n=1 Tax=Amycolatopsis sp. MEPSY49 TaxID=3151600 RepID=UPI003EF7533D